jgi:tRNA pseudouridine32 synthase / 23S rRNA pseudouridine746 synthase
LAAFIVGTWRGFSPVLDCEAKQRESKLLKNAQTLTELATRMTLAPHATKNSTPDMWVRDGVRASTVALPGHVSQWPRLLDFLVHQLHAPSEDAWLQRAQRGLLLSGQGVPLSAADVHAPPRPGLVLRYWREIPSEADLPVQHKLVWRCELLVVADKPHGLPVVPSGVYARETLLARLIRELDLPDLQPLHRIDRDTAGLVAFSVHKHHRNAYQQLFAQRQVVKRYHAVVHNNALANAALDQATDLDVHSRLQAAAHFMQMQSVAGEPNAHTRMRRLARADHAKHGPIALMQLDPSTGQRHQLRVQLMALGAPIVNDGIYPTLLPERTPIDALDNPLQLRASALAFTDPITHEQRQFESGLPLAVWDESQA